MFLYGNLRISRLENFKNRSFSWGQGFAQSEPNLAWSIPCLSRVLNKKNFCYKLPRKKVRVSYGNLRISRLENFENRSISSGEGLVQIKPNLACDISSAYNIFFCLQGDDANKENLVQTEMMPTMPKSARFFGFQCKFENLAEAKRKLKNLYPDAASIVFFSSRPNQTGLNGCNNFTKEIQCEKFRREIRQNPPKN